MVEDEGEGDPDDIEPASKWEEEFVHHLSDDESDEEHDGAGMCRYLQNFRRVNPFPKTQILDI